MKPKKIKLGFIPANRGFFSTKLAQQMRGETIKAMRAQGIQVIVPDAKMTQAGCVETREEALKCGKMFRDKDVDGIVVGAVNFGDEQSVALTIKAAGLDVPVLIFGCQEEEVLTMQTSRRDAFCGLLSIGEALRQIGQPYTVAQTPITYPSTDGFAQDLQHFAAVCRVVGGVKNARYGQIGARPDAFWTCRLNEKSLQKLGPTVVTLDLSEVMGKMDRMPDTGAAIKNTIKSFAEYANISALPEASLIRMAKFERVVKDFVKENGLDGLGIQCWTSIQENIGMCSCTTMSRMGDLGVPSACESDIYGTLSMHAIVLAGQTPAALADWNNQHNEDPDLANIWHCGVFPKSFAGEMPRLGNQEIIAGTVGREKAWGTCEFKMREAPITLCRLNEDPDEGFKVYIGQGRTEPDAPGETFGSYGWTRIPNLTKVYRDILVRHFPHHVAIGMCHVGNALYEAFGNYLGMKCFVDGKCETGGYSPSLPFEFAGTQEVELPE